MEGLVWKRAKSGSSTIDSAARLHLGGNGRLRRFSYSSCAGSLQKKPHQIYSAVKPRRSPASLGAALTQLASSPFAPPPRNRPLPPGAPRDRLYLVWNMPIRPLPDSPPASSHGFPKLAKCFENRCSLFSFISTAKASFHYASNLPTFLATADQLKLCPATLSPHRRIPQIIGKFSAPRRSLYTAGSLPPSSPLPPTSGLSLSRH